MCVCVCAHARVCTRAPLCVIPREEFIFDFRVKETNFPLSHLSSSGEIPALITSDQRMLKKLLVSCLLLCVGSQDLVALRLPPAPSCHASYPVLPLGTHSHRISLFSCCTVAPPPQPLLLVLTVLPELTLLGPQDTLLGEGERGIRQPPPKRCPSKCVGALPSTAYMMP